MNKKTYRYSALFLVAVLGIAALAAWQLFPRQSATPEVATSEGHMGHAGHRMETEQEIEKREPVIAVLPPAKTLYKALSPAAYSSYPLRAVGVHGGDDWIPDLSAVATKEVSSSGAWSKIFPYGALAPADIVKIPKGVMVIYDISTTTPLAAIHVAGTLAFSTTTPTKMSVGTIFVDGGTLAIDASRTTADILFKGSVSKEKDPLQITLGFVAGGGTVSIQGRVLSQPFAYAEGNAGERTLRLDRAVDWRAGDEVYVSSGNDASVDSTFWAYNHRDWSLRRPFPETGERAKVVSVRGAAVTLDKALSYDHAQSVAADVTRSVTFRSDPANAGGARGHVMLAGMTDATVQYARFYDLGRTTIAATDDTLVPNGVVTHTGTNQRGRYALHAHHLMRSFLFEGNVVYGSEIARKVRSGTERAVSGSPKWGIVNHDSNGIIRRNVVIGAAGSGIVGEDGTETGVVENNLVIGTGGGSGDNDDERFGVTKSLDMAHGGFGYWFRGPFLEVRNNIAAGHFNQAAYTYFVHPGFLREFIRDDPGVPADLRGKRQKDLVSVNTIRQFSGNTAAGYFGNAGFVMFYSQVVQPIDSFTMRAFGSGPVDGVLSRIMKGMRVSNSDLRGTGGGDALVASESGPVEAVNTVIDHFAQ
ncbi:MAG TPA: G8 domain-containing protein [Candidatus Paceibacterota bacterium]